MVSIIGCEGINCLLLSCVFDVISFFEPIILASENTLRVVVGTGGFIEEYNIENLLKKTLLFLLPGCKLPEEIHSRHWNHWYIWKCCYWYSIQPIFLFCMVSFNDLEYWYLCIYFSLMDLKSNIPRCIVV